MSGAIRIEMLDETTDERGWSFSVLAEQLSAIGPIRDVHVAAVKPGHVRGNHFHSRRGEVIAVIHHGAWSLHWDTGPGTGTSHREFAGRGAVLVVPPRNWSHAVRNDGDADLQIVAMSDVAFDRHAEDAAARDAVPRRVTD